MKTLRLAVIAFLLFGSFGSLYARRMRGWTYQELLDKSDLVVIATPTQTRDTEERADLPNIYRVAPDGKESGIAAVGLESTFRIRTILKGDKTSKEFVLHYYRLLKPNSIAIDAPALATFEPNKMAFLLFLVREPDGRYAPCSGQTDPTLFSVLALHGMAE